MKNFKNKFFFTVVVLSLILSVTLITGAQSYIREIKAAANDIIKLYVNNQQYDLKESDGSKLPVVIINGRSYLPVRAVADIVGYDVKWDEKTNSIYLSNDSNNGGTPYKDNTPTGTTTNNGTNSNTATPSTAKGSVSFKYDYTYDSKVRTADVKISLLDIRTGNDAVNFAKSKNIDISGLAKDDLVPIAVKLRYEYKNIYTTEGEDYLSIWFEPNDIIKSGNTTVIGGTEYFEDGVYRNSSGIKVRTGDNASYEGWAIYGVLRNEKNNKLGFMPTKAYGADYVWLTLTE